MQYLGDDELTQVMGLGYLGEVRQGPDGRLYQWVQGIDGLGNPVGFWKRLKRFVKRALPIAEKIAPFIPVYGPAVAAGIKVAKPFLKRAGMAQYEGLGALYEAPDGSLYQVQGLAQDEELRGLGEEETLQTPGIGYPGEVRQGLDGHLYQWVEGVDGLGNPGGFWKRLKRFVKRAVPLAEKIAPFIPVYGQAVAAGLKVAKPFLKQAGMAQYEGLGALYQAPDGSFYQVQGLAEEEDLRGSADGEELRGLADDEELKGFAAEEELQGLEQGYVRQDEVSGLEAYLPEEPPRTNWFTPAAQPPGKRTVMWEPLW
jgi:hypothetical protein